MGSVKAVLFKGKVYQDGSSPICIQVIHNGTIKRQQVFKLLPVYWNSKQGKVKETHPQADQYNQVLRDNLNNTNEKYLQLRQKKAIFEAEDVFTYKEVLSIQDAIFNYAKRPGTSFAAIEKYNNLLNKVNLFSGDKSVNIEAITNKWMDRFKHFLQAQNIGTDEKVRNLQEGTVNRHLSNIKTVLRHSGYHHSDVMIYKTPKGEGKAVPLEYTDFEKIRDCETPSGILTLIKDIFLFQTYIRGTRIGETLMLKKEQIKGDRIVGTKSNKTGKERSLQLIRPALEIVEKYQGKSDYYIFPMLKMKPGDPKKDRRYRRHIQSKTAMMNIYLKEIADLAGTDIRLTTHMSRHTFALMCVKAGLDLKTIQGLLDHGSIATTAKYLRGLTKENELDDATNKVFGF